MKRLSYKEFSFTFHHKSLEAGRPTDCQFELTFGCDYHCLHCYTSCYNQKSCLRKELKTDAVLAILSKVRGSGVLWLCLTGGDPLRRQDFGEIYNHAKDLGFIITVFTNGFQITAALVRRWREMPPFVVEITMNAAGEKLYEKISGCRGSFARLIKALDRLQSASIAVKLKTQVTCQNQQELPRLKAFAAQRRLPWKPDFLLHPRLNGDKAPCRLRPRLSSGASVRHQGIISQPDCGFSSAGLSQPKKPLLFPCAIDSGARLQVDPYGFGFLCCFLRQPKYDLRRLSVAKARQAALAYARGRRYHGEPVCPSCLRRTDCILCPGLAYLETHDPEAVVGYYCRLAGLKRLIFANC